MMYSFVNHYVMYIITVVMLLLWFLGTVSSFTLGGYLHILLGLASLIIILRAVSPKGV